MANNYVVKDANGATVTKSATDVGGGTEADRVQVCDATAAHFLPTGDAQARAVSVQVGDGTTGGTVKAAGVLQNASSDTALVVAPTPAADGTHTTPIGDAQARAINVIVGNGTQTLPSGDALARVIFTKPSDGTTAITVKAASTLQAATDTGLVVRPLAASDGTHSTPIGDAAARGLYVIPNDGTNPVSVAPANTPANPVSQTALVVAPLQATDGTHQTPIGDAAARALVSKITDGTNTVAMDNSAELRVSLYGKGSAAGDTALLSMDTVGHAGYQYVTDGTHTQPTGDAAARSIFTQITDATHGPAAVKAASTAAALTDPALVVAISPNCPLSKPTAGSPIRVSAKTAIKGSAGALFGLTAINTSGSTVWVQLFDAATTGAVTLGSTLPDLEVQVAATTTLTVPLPADGVPFGSGIIYAATTAEGGSTAASAGALLLFPVWA